MIIENLKLVVDRNVSSNQLYLRNLLKEQLHLYVLNFVYNSKYSKDFIFKGGTCLRFCYGLPRLSEDLDFDVLNFRDFSYKTFSKDLKSYFESKMRYHDLDIKISGENNLIYVKFPVLQEVGFPVRPDKPTDAVLFVRLDITPMRGSFYETELKLKSSQDFSFLINCYSLPDILSGKIAAILMRQEKEGGELKPRFKGRDYFDIYFLLQKGINANFKYLSSITGIKSKRELVKSFDSKIKMAVKKKGIIKADLTPFFMDQNFVNNFVDNMDKFDWALTFI